MKKLASAFVATLIYSVGFSQLPVVNAVGGEDEIDYQPIVDEYMAEYPEMDGPGIILGQCSQGLNPVSASSTLDDQGKNDYSIANIQDDDPLSAWVEGEDGYGIGVWFEIEAVGVTAIWNGYQKSISAFKNNSRVKQFKVYKNREPFCLLNLQDKMGAQYFELPGENEGMPDWDNPNLYRFEITEVYEGAKWKDVAITEIDYMLCCFSASTVLSTTGDGIVAKDMTDGMIVKTLDLASDKTSTGVIELSQGVIHTTLYKITTKSSSIEITIDHPMYFEGYGFTSIQGLLSMGIFSNIDEIATSVKIMLWNEAKNEAYFEPLQSIEVLEGEFKTYTILELSEGNTYIANGFVTKTYSVK